MPLTTASWCLNSRWLWSCLVVESRDVNICHFYLQHRHHFATNKILSRYLLNCVLSTLMNFISKILDKWEGWKDLQPLSVLLQLGVGGRGGCQGAGHQRGAEVPRGRGQPRPAGGRGRGDRGGAARHGRAAEPRGAAALRGGGQHRAGAAHVQQRRRHRALPSQVQRTFNIVYFYPTAKYLLSGIIKN